MKKLALSLLLFVTLFGSFAPTAFAANATFFGPIVPEECNCKEVTSPNTGQKVPSAPDWGCVMQVVQNSINFAISIGVIIAIIYIVWTGFLFVVSAGNPSQREAAKTRIMNVVIGMLVMLAAWLIIDFVMKTLYDGGGKFGPWNSILGDAAPKCIEVSKRPDKLPNVIGQPSPGGVDVVPDGGSMPDDPNADGAFSYQSGIAAQAGHASPTLNALLACMVTKVPANVGQISSISDSAIVNGSQTFASCAANGCAHVANSCHYGGRTCVGSSYAVDFGDENNASVLIKAANACGAKSAAIHNGNHVHVTAQSNCGCT